MTIRVSRSQENTDEEWSVSGPRTGAQVQLKGSIDPQVVDGRNKSLRTERDQDGHSRLQRVEQAKVKVSLRMLHNKPEVEWRSEARKTAIETTPKAVTWKARSVAKLDQARSRSERSILTRQC